MSGSRDSADDRAYPLLMGSMALAVFLVVTAVAMLGPLLVDMAGALGVTVPLAGQLVTAAAAVWGATALVAGPVSDAYGRKPVLLAGLCFLAAGSLGIGLAPTFAAAAGFSLLVGVGGGMVPPTCIALVGDLIGHRRQPRSIAILTMQPGMSILLGVPLAAVLGDFAGWRVPFLALGLVLLLSALLLLVLVPYRRPPASRANLAGRMMRVAAFPVTWCMAGTNVLARGAWGAVLTFLPPYLILTYGLRTAEVGLPMAFVALWMTAAPLLAGRIGRMRKRLGVTAALLLAASLPALGIFFLGWGTWFSVLGGGALHVAGRSRHHRPLDPDRRERGRFPRRARGRHIQQQLGRHCHRRGCRRRADRPFRLWRALLPAGRRRARERPAHGLRGQRKGHGPPPGPFLSPAGG